MIALSVNACSGSQPVKTKVALRCPEMPRDIVAESRRNPVIKGDSAMEIAANLVEEGKRKNRALRRSIKLYKACRRG